jgi:hypothetical protein
MPEKCGATKFIKGYPDWVDEPGMPDRSYICDQEKGHSGTHSQTYKESDGGGTGHYDSWYETYSWEEKDE